ncbi:MAG: TrkH family potassium uptake protein [Planctomycetaceae bacterium]
MEYDPEATHRLMARESSRPRSARFWLQADRISQVLGVAATILSHGLGIRGGRNWELGALSFVSMLVVAIGFFLRHRWSLTRRTLRRRESVTLAVAVTWAAGLALLTIFGPLLPRTSMESVDRWSMFVRWSEFLIVVRAAAGIVSGLRALAAQQGNPALLLVLSFALLIGLGTVLLMLPAARADGDIRGGAGFSTALFTATSASCVTGLVVEQTGTFWSPVGQAIIMGLFQIGGFGIMTYGALFAVVAGREVKLREFTTIRELLAAEGIGDARRLLLRIAGFTLGAELLGALLLSGLWADHSLEERVWFGLFHSVSAFCNAGFALTPDSFVGWETRWQVWGVVAGLIICGGLGFNTLGEVASLVRRRLTCLWRSPDHRHVRLTLTSWLVIVTTLTLLIAGTVLVFVLEGIDRQSDGPLDQSIANAWFQSVTFRTAGFNTLDLGSLHPASKLVAIILMFVGASPGSTGGGVKTVVLALAWLGVGALLRGRNSVECRGRTIPADMLTRALSILLLAGSTIMTATILICIFENRADRFLDHLFEATSATGTVGVSSSVPLADGTRISVTQSLSWPSRMVLVAAMFLGRLGPLTMLLAMSGSSSTVRYDYPHERVTLT